MSEATADRPTVDEIRAEAAKIANSNPPSRVLLTCILGILSGVGWVYGRSWFSVAHLFVFCGLAMKYGYWNGAKVPADQRIKRKPQTA